MVALGSRGGTVPIALQYFYSLVNRDIEDEHLPLAADSGLGVVPWSPLAYGLLTGKYVQTAIDAVDPREGAASSASRLDGPNPFGDTLFTDRNWRIVDALRAVAGEMNLPPALVALAWVMGRPGITSTLLGASRADQVTENVRALQVQLSLEQRATLDAVSANEPRMLYTLFAPPLRDKAIFGGNTVTGWR